MPNALEHVALRQTNWSNSGEQSFIYNAWLNSYRQSRQRGPLSGATYWKAYAADIDLLYQRPGLVAITATLDDDPDQFLGFMCGERRPGLEYPILHYAYVKKYARQAGIGGAMVSALAGGDNAPIFTTYNTPSRDYLVRHRPAYSNVRLAQTPEYTTNGQDRSRPAQP